MNKQNRNRMVARYRWREAFAPIWHTTRCEVLEYNNKTAKIKLLEFGKNGARPGTEMRVHLKSLVGFKPIVDEPEWHKYAYFE